MDDWTPIAEAVGKLGGVLGGGTLALCQQGRDGLVEARADVVISFSVPEPFEQAQARDAPHPNAFGVVPIRMPMHRVATERTEDRLASLPAGLWGVLAQADPFHQLWSGGALEIPQPDGIGRYAIYGIRVRAVRADRPETERICMLMADWMRSERAAGRKGTLHAAAQRFAGEFGDAGKQHGEGTLQKRLTRAFPGFYPDL